MGDIFATPEPRTLDVLREPHDATAATTTRAKARAKNAPAINTASTSRARGETRRRGGR
jgi:hypothetical protein